MMKIKYSRWRRWRNKRRTRGQEDKRTRGGGTRIDSGGETVTRRSNDFEREGKQSKAEQSRASDAR